MDEEDKKESEGAGCLQFIAIIIVSIAVGHLTSEAWGWLTFGTLLFIASTL